MLLGTVARSWKLREEAEILTLSRQSGAEEVPLFFLSWQVGHKTDSAPRCLLWLRVWACIGLLRSRVPAPDLEPA